MGGDCLQWLRPGRGAGPRSNGSPELDGSDSDSGTPLSGGSLEEGALRQNGLESRRERSAKVRAMEPLQRSSFL